MKKIFFVFPALFLLAAACNSQTATTVQTPAKDSVQTQQQASSDSSFTYIGKRPSGPNADLYKGNLIVEGKFYKDYPEAAFFGGSVLFKIDSSYLSKLPKNYVTDIIYFDNNQDANTWFKIDDSVFEDKKICQISGTAKISIKDYTVELLEGEVHDHTNLVQVISASKPTTQTCKELGQPAR